MKIETKYDVDQEVWFIDKNKIISEKILKINYKKSKDEEIITYHFLEAENTIDWDRKRLENQIFNSKEDLISSL